MAGEWHRLSLGEVITLQRGHDLPIQDRKPGAVPVVTSSGISGTHNESKATAPGVVMGRYGTLGDIYYIQEDYWPHNTSLYVKDFKENNPKYIYYLLKTLDFGVHSDKTSVPGLNRNHLHTIEVSLPPLPEQRHIAHILGTLDDKIELNRQMNRTLEAMARTLFKAWFVDFAPARAKAEGRDTGLPAEIADLFPSRLVDSELGEIPEGWGVGKLADLCAKVENGGTPKRSEASYWSPPELPWLTSGEVRESIIIRTENHISELGLEASSAKVWESGTIVVALYGATAGQVALLGLDSTANQACCGLSPKEEFRSYLYYLARNSTSSLELRARGSAQQNLSQQIVADFEVVLPPTDTSAVFEQMASPLLRKMESNLREVHALAELRDTLLPRLLSGELRVSAAEEVAFG